MVGRGYFLAWWDVFLGIFDVDRCIRGQIGVFLGVSGRFFGYFRCIKGFFWVFSRLIGIFSGYFQWPGFQIGGVGGGSGGRCWLQLVCVWLGVCGRC